MLLRHTTAEVTERKALTANPAKTCQPVGAMYAALGIHGCLPHSHGSQGCCAYHRSVLTRHYKEPVLAATSSFTEGSSVFGGQANLLQAIDNIFTVYSPDLIAVHTTCLSETIGDDMVQIIRKAKDDGKIPEGKMVIHTNTPSYQGSHVTGFANMVRSMVDYFSTDGGQREKLIDIIPGWVEPPDMREIARLCDVMGVNRVIFPDTSGVLDGGLDREPKHFPDGGTTVADLHRTGNARACLALGPTASGPAGRHLENTCSVPCEVLELPIGLAATDRFIDALRRSTGLPVPDSITWERARLLDLISDMSQYLYGKSVALWGDPDQVVALTEFVTDLGMKPRYILTGTPGKVFNKRIETALGGRITDAKIAYGARADMLLLHQWIKGDKPDLLIGNTYGKYIARDDDIPYIRHGFPILDRVGHTLFPTVGYRGAMRLVEQILTGLMDRQDRDCPEERFELVM